MALELVGNMALALMVVAPKRVEASVWSVSFRHTGKLKMETAKMTTPCPTCGMKCKAQIYYNDDDEYPKMLNPIYTPIQLSLEELALFMDNYMACGMCSSCYQKEWRKK